MESVDTLVIGAGPAGLRAAQVLAEAGREVLVLEKNPEIGPKTCAGGLTRKTVAELSALGLPPDVGLEQVGFVSFAGEPVATPDLDATVVRTVPRRVLGRFQAAWARSAGAEIRTGTPVLGVELDTRTVRWGGSTIRYRHLVGADGADSAVRRALRLPRRRAYLAAEFNVRGLSAAPLRIECDGRNLANGYFWVFPHCDYTSVGAVAEKHVVPPSALRRYLEGRLRALGGNVEANRFEAATLEVEFAGLDFAGGVHLVGDAAGVPSSLTAEGIYAALITGEETARRILEPGYPSPKTRRWLRVKRTHDMMARALRSAPVRTAALPAMALAVSWPRVARHLARWFLRG